MVSQHNYILSGPQYMFRLIRSIITYSVIPHFKSNVMIQLWYVNNSLVKLGTGLELNLTLKFKIC
jgi:hypothetical protein